MKKIISIILSVIILLTACVGAAFNTYAVSDGDFDITLNDLNQATVSAYKGNKSSVIIQSTIKGYEVIAIGNFAFFMNYDVIDITISDGIKTIGNSAFHDCNALTDITLGNDVESIGENAFYNCFHLSAIHIPASVKSIGDNAFKRTERLKTITADSANQYFTAVDNVLFNKDMTKLIRYASAKSETAYTVPMGVETIDSGAFFYAKNLTDITIPSTVTSIGADAFDSASAIKTVRYGLTEEDWKKIAISDGNSILSDPNVEFIFNTEHEHTYTEEVTKEATCTESGVITYTCTLGDDSYTVDIPALGHQDGEPVYENVSDATCTEPGSYDEVIYCTVCGEELSRVSKSNEKIPHTSAVKVNRTEPTYEEEGLIETITYCEVCGEVLSTETEIIEKLVAKNGWEKQDGKWYLYKDNVLQTGWQKVNGKWYYMNTDGVMQTGWLKTGGKWYYLKASGAMVTGWKKISDKWYYFNPSGAMATGWKKVDGKWYYLKASGAMATGWLKDNGKWYYLNSDGSMVTGAKNINGKKYTFNQSGACQNP